MWEIVPERLESVMRRERVNQSQLAALVGLKQPSIARLLTGETRTTRFVDRIASVLNTTPAFLRGDTDDDSASDLVADRRTGFRGFAPSPDAVQLDEIDVAFGLGGSYLDSAVSVRKVSFSREWLRHFTDTAPEHLFSATGIGESMYPTIHTSDVVLVDRSQNTARMADQIWACVYGEVGMIKRLRPLPNGGVEILSDNPSVPPKTAFDGELHIIGRVVAVVRRM